MGVEITEARSDVSGRQWDAFLEAQPTGSFYHCYGWKQLNERHFGHSAIFLEARDSGSPRWCAAAGTDQQQDFRTHPLFDALRQLRRPRGSRRRSHAPLIDAAQARAALEDVDYLELRCAAPLETDMHCALHKISMTVDLAPDPDQLWNKFTSKHRTNIRRVYKDGFTVTSGGQELLPDFYDVMQRSWRDLGTPIYSPAYFQAIIDAFPDQTRIFVCYLKGEPVAVAFNGYFAGKVEGMWAGTTRVGHDLHANYVLYWEMIKDACERGCRRYHLGRSTAGSGAEQFKKKWNAETSQLYWYYHRPGGHFKPVVNVNHPSFQLGIAAWRKMPLWATRVIGPRLARVIP